jgi:cyclohexa-1,5-dienecarbonyl-CoA hydratase
MSHLKFINHEIVDGVATLTFNRPKHNVLNIEMMNELNGQLDEPGQRRIAQVRGPGGQRPQLVRRCRGGRPPAGDGGRDDRHLQPHLRDRPSHAVPTIAAVQGACLGGGMEVAMACDIIVAAPKAVFGQPEIKLGFFPPYAAIRLPQLVGPARAVEICTTGRRYKAEANPTAWAWWPTCPAKRTFQETVDRIVL